MMKSFERLTFFREREKVRVHGSRLSVQMLQLPSELQYASVRRYHRFERVGGDSRARMHPRKLPETHASRTPPDFVPTTDRPPLPCCFFEITSASFTTFSTFFSFFFGKRNAIFYKPPEAFSFSSDPHG